MLGRALVDAGLDMLGSNLSERTTVVDLKKIVFNLYQNIKNIS
jgi:hypothetical protein